MGDFGGGRVENEARQFDELPEENEVARLPALQGYRQGRFLQLLRGRFLDLQLSIQDLVRIDAGIV